ncbi:insulinase family protein [uncultured Slackia sp.]|uniref:insulinase family protein n=1 Tax=uncultured Slackia sp. TaxID=665903 RepID=UPI0025E438BD|nr:insulinase family protein [uncultured Slackia sp.]
MLTSDQIGVIAAAHGFGPVQSEPLNEIDGVAHVMRHEKSGARLLFLENEDENKAFSITFKTPPADDTGVFHILEHSVLCGSDKFPVKEPFVNLLKTSMQTFLNALTFPDKTMYPVASTNDQDLLNLMDVYMDAVLHPMIYSKRAIFEQEGWHFELDEAEGDAPEALRYNGVVFNEMKGALADPDSVLYHAVNAALFPGTCYEFESGGHPRAIPQLTYEGYLDTHARHYRLDNSYIVLYGDLDLDRVLGFLDERYLSAADCAPRTDDAPNEIGIAAPRVTLDVEVPMDTAPENATVGVGYVIGEARDFERVLAADVLMDALMGGNESPIKRAVLDAGLGGDATAYLLDSQAQPVAMFQLKGAKPGVACAFMELIESEARRLAEEGIPRDLLEASLSQMAFDLRERDRGMADGVPLAMNALAGWLYGDDMATTYLHYEDVLAHMRAGLDGRYFEDVLASLLPANGHKALVDVVPQETGGETEEAAELAVKLASMSSEDKERVQGDVAELRRLQEEPDSPEALATLPQLHVSDIGAARPDTQARRFEGAPLTCLHYDMPTRHIDYLRLYIDIDHLNWDDLPYVTILSMLLCRLDTAQHTAADLDTYARSHLGNLRFAANVYAPDGAPDDLSLKMVVSASALSEELEHLASIPREIWETTRFDDAGKIRDVLVQRRIAMEQAFMNEGHTRAISRMTSYFFKSCVLREQMSGVDFYLFLKDLIEHFDERFDELKARLEDMRARVFSGERVTASFVGSREDCAKFWELAGTLGFAAEGPACVLGAESAAEDVERSRIAIPEPQAKDEAFVVSGDVVYVAKGADVSGMGAFDGAWSVASNALSFDYLWNEVRVKGGAYGVGFRRVAAGLARYYSFRDPAVDPTIKRFDAAGEWLAAFEPDADEMEGYIVSTVATHDAPVKPKAAALRQDGAYFTGKPVDWREKTREQILAATPEVLRGFAPTLDAVAKSGHVCVFGSKELISAAKSVDLEVTELF